MEDVFRRLAKLEDQDSRQAAEIATLKSEVAVIQSELRHITKRLDNKDTERSTTLQRYASLVAIAGFVLIVLGILARAGWPLP